MDSLNAFKSIYQIVRQNITPA